MKIIALALMVLLGFSSSGIAQAAPRHVPIKGHWKGHLNPIACTCYGSSWSRPIDFDLRIIKGPCDGDAEWQECAYAAKSNAGWWYGYWDSLDSSIGLAIHNKQSQNGRIYSYGLYWEWQHNFGTRYQVVTWKIDVSLDGSHICSATYRGSMRRYRR